MGNFLQSLAESTVNKPKPKTPKVTQSSSVDTRNEIENAQLHRHLHTVVNGYLKQKFSIHANYHHFEQSLINIMIAYLGNILFAFDIYPSRCKSMFTQYG